jgi:hypothetical protein
MSCDVAVSAVLFLASLHPGAAPAPTIQPAVAEAAKGTNPLTREPLFADIIQRAGGLEKDANAYRKVTGALPKFDVFKTRIAELSALDLKGHLTLAERGTDGDLKCILKGISQDLPRKLDEIATATDPKARDLALSEMAYLLNDNVGVITAPPSPPV